ncbi:MAG TPA: electron transfer flavoprotein subunit beta/FixA family protein [Myxococcota bacterium]|nr:electron transfer flavoprotein subunit beta/FixA family protein [Myxococcota bacterium]
MDIVVCIKQVADITDVDLELNEAGTELEREDLVLGINEWDDYAVETAVRIKEAHGAKVTVLTVGPEETVLRRALAMGADHAVRVEAHGAEGMGIARAIAAVIRERPCDLVLTGAMASDTCQGLVGPALAAMLGIPHAALAVGLELRERSVRVRRELEANTIEEVDLDLPALVTVQTGISQRRYVSVMGIRRVRRIEIEVLDAGPVESSAIQHSRLSLPQRGEGAEMLEGSLSEICERAARIIHERLGGR